MDYTNEQQDIVQSASDVKIYLDGPAGTGKTTAGVGRLAHLLENGVDGASILVMVPQRTLALPYYNYLQDPSRPPGGEVTVTTLGGVARRAIEVYWPDVAAAHGFAQPDHPPTFLSLETAQYFMARVAGPEIDRQGFFPNVKIDRNRLYSQIIDNLNKAAVVGFPYTELGERLKAAWIGDIAQIYMYDHVQECANLFRAFCLQNGLVDFSLQIELLRQRLMMHTAWRQSLADSTQHIIADNIEEDTPAAHEFLARILEEADSALLISDAEAGYRRFLGADPENAARLHGLCDRVVNFSESLVTAPAITAFEAALHWGLRAAVDEPAPEVAPRAALDFTRTRYHPQMIDAVAERVRGLVLDEGVPPQEIVIIAPYLSDALRFSLMNRLAPPDVPGDQIPVRSHRPSRALREEPAVIALLTLAQLAHPDWRLPPTRYDIVYMLMAALQDIDLIRAQMLTLQGYDPGKALPLKPFEAVSASYRQRITFTLGQRYDHLREWLLAYQAENTEQGDPPLDHFFSRLFGEVLSQPGYGFHDAFDDAEIAANLIESARRFRWMLEGANIDPAANSAGQDYVAQVAGGVLADQYVRRWEISTEDAVLLAPAYTFLMMNRPVTHQFWLNVGGAGWAERLYQPLTNPYVLAQDWPMGRKWTDGDDAHVSREALQRLTAGLLRRCRGMVHLYISELGEQGIEQRGELLIAMQEILRQYPLDADEPRA